MFIQDIKNGAYTFRVSGNTPKFKGFKAVYDKEQEVDETETAIYSQGKRHV